MSRFLVVVLALVGLALVGSYVLLVSGETQEDYYPSLREAGDMMGRGWIPLCVPNSATDIRIRSNVDTNIAFGQFRFSPADADALKKAMTSQPGDLELLPGGRPGLPSWWPRALSAEWDAAALQARGFEVGRCEGVVPFGVVVNRSEGLALFWTQGR